MSKRMTFSNPRWIADYRPLCIQENELKARYNVSDDFQYSQILQKNGKEIYDQRNKKVPVVKVNGVTFGQNQLQ